MRFEPVWGEARVAALRDATPSVREFVLVPTDGRPRLYAAGSHLHLGVTIGGRPDTRSYSLVGEAAREGYRIAVKRQPASRGGSAYLWSLPVGATLAVSEPQTLLTIDYDRPEYLLVAGGIGITPILSLATLLARRGSRVRLLYAARERAELAFLPELEAALGDRLVTFVGAEGRRIDLNAALSALSPGAMPVICGPLPMIDAARRAWVAAGRPAPDIRYETFGSSGARPPEAFTVRLAATGREIVVPGDRSMLDALADAGVEVISDCRRGECGICALGIVDHEGEIDHRDVFFSEAQRAENDRICACVSRATGIVTVDTLYRHDEGAGAQRRA